MHCQPSLRGFLLAAAMALAVTPGIAIGNPPCKHAKTKCHTARDCCEASCVGATKNTFGTCCNPTTCAAAQCGLIANGDCPGTLDCGACAPPATCGGGGTPNVCGTSTTTSTSTSTTTTTAPMCSLPCPDVCNGKCTDTQVDATNCGQCGHSCWTDEACNQNRDSCAANPRFCAQSGSNCGACADGVCLNFAAGNPAHLNYCCGNGLFVQGQFTGGESGACQCQGDWIGTDCCTFNGPPDQTPPSPGCFNGGVYCSGNGICDLTTNQCQCKRQWGGAACDVYIGCLACELGPCCPPFGTDVCPSYAPVCSGGACTACTADADCVSSGFGDTCNVACECSSDAACTAPSTDRCTNSTCVCGTGIEPCRDGKSCVAGVCM